MDKIFIIRKTLAIAIFLCAVSLTAFAQDDVVELKKQISQLEEKVKLLEQNQKNNIKEDKQDISSATENEWDPFIEIKQMDREVSKMFQEAFSHSSNFQNSMLTNRLFFDGSKIEENKNGYVIKFDIANLDKNKININVNDSSITVSGEYNQEQKQNDKNRYFEAHNYGKFLNTIPLPKDADSSKMKTQQKDQQLEIFLPKKQNS